MIEEKDLRARLAAYLQNRLSLDQFEDWLVDTSWNMHRDSAPAVQALVSSIELLLAEYSNGDRTYDELGRELVALASTVETSITIPIVGAVTSVRRPRFGANAYQIGEPRSSRLALQA
jgi:hypothetical protein